ncbi:MAG: PAS domain-containing sensor histidine kinase [Armatimonadota bacterium]
MSTDITTEAHNRVRLLEEEVVRLRAQLHDTIERVTDAFFAVDSGWCLTYVNRAAEPLLRKPAAGLLCRSLWEEFPEAVGTVFWDEYHRAMREQQPVSFEAYYAPFNTWFAVHAYPSPDGLSVYFRDVTEQVRLRRELEDSNTELTAQSEELQAQMEELEEQRDALETISRQLKEASDEAERRATILEGIFESTHACLALMDRAFNFLMVNTAYAEGCGHRAEELIGQNHFALFPYGENETLFTSVCDSGEAYYAEARAFEYADQPERGVSYWDWSLVPIKDRQGCTQQLLLSLTDVTPLVRARQQVEELAEAARQRAAELDAAFSADADGLIVYGPNAEILRMNPAAERLLGYAAGDLRQHFAQRTLMVHALDEEGQPFAMDRTPIWRALHGETVSGQVMTLQRGDGTTISLSASAAPIRAADGTVTGAVSSFTDISPLRALQERQKIFLHMVSHDLRTPLAIIHGHAEIVSEALNARSEDDLLKESLETICRSVHRMDAMIDDLVEAARLEGRQFELQLAPVALGPFFDDLLSRTRAALDTGRVQVELAPALPPVLADHHRLERIVINLISNALKYSPPDVPVRVSVERREGEVAVAVSDRGCGIAPDELPHLFQGFYRARIRKADSIGLGLYITRLLIEAHGGQIGVDSAVGQGSTFTFTLPVA